MIPQILFCNESLDLNFTETQNEISKNQVFTSPGKIVFSEIVSPFKSPISDTGILKRKFSRNANSEDQGLGKFIKNNSLFSIENIQESIFDLYKIAEENPLCKEIIGEQLQLIENYFIFFNYSDHKIIREWICNFLKQNIDLTTVMEELGALYFFLERETDLPNIEGTTYMKLRAQEIKEEVFLLEKNCDKVFDYNQGNQISGKAHYIDRAFAHMVLTKRQIVNPGAFYSLRAYLTNASYGICRFFKSEYRNALLTILKNLEQDPCLKELLGTQFAIHETMQIYVFLTLKRPILKGVTSAHAMWAILISLFSDLRQKEGEGNCYAIATLNYLVLNHTTLLIKILIGALKDRKINGEDIFPIEDESYSEEHLSEYVCIKKLQKYDLLNFTNKLFNKTKDVSELKSSMHSLNEVIEKQFSLKTEKIEKTDFERFFFSFQSNPLIKILLTTSSAYCLNQFKNGYICYKNELIKRLITPFAKFPIHSALKNELNKCLWLKEHHERYFNHTNDLLTYGPPPNQNTIQVDAENVNAYIKILSEHVQLFIKEGSTFTKINTISDLQIFLSKIVQKITNDQNQTEKLKIIDLFLKSETYRYSIAKYCCDNITNGSTCIQPKDILKNDKILLPGDGGNGDLLIKYFFKLEVNEVTLTSNSWEDFFTQYFHFLHTLAPSIFSNTPAFFMEQINHNFLLDPKTMGYLRSYEGDAQCFLKKHVYEPAYQLLDKEIPVAIVIEITHACFKDENSAARFLEKYEIMKNKTYKEFRKLILKTFKSDENLAHILNLVDYYFYSTTVSFSEFLEILKQCNVQDIEKAALETLYGTYLSKIENKLSPAYLIADRMYLAGTDEELIILDVSELERAICKVKGLPFMIDIGDTNYGYNEWSYHPRYKLRYHFGLKALHLFSHFEEEEMLENFEHFASFSIYLPSKK